MISPLETKIVLLVVAFIVVIITVSLKKEERVRGVAVLLAWLVPGAGHALLGRWKKGLFFFSLLGATYLFGLWIVGFRAIAWDDSQQFYYVGQWGSGATYFLAKLMSAERAAPRPDLHPSWFDPGLLYVCTAGLLNVVVTLNVLEVKRAPRPASKTEAAAPPAAGEARP